MNSWDTQASCDLRSTVYEEPPQLVFLTYIARSGSTFLAHQLDSLRDVNVSLEAALPDGFVRPAVYVAANREGPMGQSLRQWPRPCKARRLKRRYAAGAAIRVDHGRGP